MLSAFCTAKFRAEMVSERLRGEMVSDGLAAFTLLWCAQQALLLFYTGLASPFDKLQAPSCMFLCAYSHAGFCSDCR